MSMEYDSWLQTGTEHQRNTPEDFPESELMPISTRPSTDFGDCVMMVPTMGQSAAKATKASDRIPGRGVCESNAFLQSVRESVLVEQVTNAL
jgi:hypothetical protein